MREPTPLLHRWAFLFAASLAWVACGKEEVNFRNGVGGAAGGVDGGGGSGTAGRGGADDSDGAASGGAGGDSGQGGVGVGGSGNGGSGSNAGTAGTGSSGGNAGTAGDGGSAGNVGTAGSGSGASGSAGSGGASGGVGGGSIDASLDADDGSNSDGDAGTADSRPDVVLDAGCPNVLGTYAINNADGMCGDLDENATQEIRSTAGPCDLHFISVNDAAPGVAINGNAALGSAGTFSGATLTLGTASRTPCTGTWSEKDQEFTVVCGSAGDECLVELRRTDP